MMKQILLGVYNSYKNIISLQCILSVMDSTDDDVLMCTSSPQNDQKSDELGEMTFYMSNYAKEALKMMQLMRQHHLLTDCVLEVENELFHGK